MRIYFEKLFFYWEIRYVSVPPEKDLTDSQNIYYFNDFYPLSPFGMTAYFSLFRNI